MDQFLVDSSKTESDKGKDWIPVWEFNGLKKADCILFWIPRTRDKIINGKTISTIAFTFGEINNPNVIESSIKNNPNGDK